jgi:hypothetical protein
MNDLPVGFDESADIIPRFRCVAPLCCGITGSESQEEWQEEDDKGMCEMPYRLVRLAGTHSM